MPEKDWDELECTVRKLLTAIYVWNRALFEERARAKGVGLDRLAAMAVAEAVCTWVNIHEGSMKVKESRKASDVSALGVPKECKQASFIRNGR